MTKTFDDVANELLAETSVVSNLPAAAGQPSAFSYEANGNPSSVVGLPSSPGWNHAYDLHL